MHLRNVTFRKTPGRQQKPARNPMELSFRRWMKLQRRTFLRAFQLPLLPGAKTYSLRPQHQLPSIESGSLVTFSLHAQIGSAALRNRKPSMRLLDNSSLKAAVLHAWLGGNANVANSPASSPMPLLQGQAVAPTSVDRPGPAKVLLCKKYSKTLHSKIRSGLPSSTV